MADTAPHPDERLRRPSGIRTLQLGDTKVSHVPDGEATLAARAWLPDSTDEDWAEHPEYLDGSGHLMASVGGLLVEHGGRALLIDTGAGPLTMGPPENPFGTLSGGALLDSLAALGRTPQDIEAVALTHLHIDHMGWAWHPAPGSDRPAFTAASYLVAEPEWAQRNVAEAQGMGPMIEALAPHVRTVADGQEIFPGVRVMLTPGHSPGHTAYVISGGGRRLIAFGDAFHSPVQISHPEWWTAGDHDSAQSTSHRRTLLTQLAEPGTTGYGGHFADVVFGRVTNDADRPAWQPVNA
jgi:glyoxylase-like metal-dependent hydrolase (beta-lactamase superfamily II)